MPICLKDILISPVGHIHLRLFAITVTNDCLEKVLLAAAAIDFGFKDVGVRFRTPKISYFRF